MKRQVAWPTAVLAVLMGLAGTVDAQTATGQITGTVKDSSGAVTPGATVTVHSDLTGLRRTATSNANGDYSFPLLPVGTYAVNAELSGFQPIKRTAIRLNAGDVVRIDLDLTPGGMTEAVEVQAATVAINTESAAVGQVVTTKQITDLPLNGRNFLSLLYLNAGAVETTGEQGAMRQGVGNAISLQGARPTSNNFMIDGTANIDTSVGTPAVILSVDALEQFTQQNKTYSAEYGFSANQINLVSKAGNNEFHGVGFLFGRNEKWDAKNFFDSPTAARPPLDQKQFGGTFSGPIIKNKTFFLVNYEGARITRGTTGFYLVPTADQLAGRFSQPIIDPMTRQPFPNNTIPQDRYSRLARLAIEQGWFPAPNIAAPQGNYQTVTTFPRTQDQFSVRIDQDLGHLGRVFARYTKTTYDNKTFGTVSAAQAGWEGGNRVFVQDTTNWQVSHTWPIHANLVNVLRVGRLEARADQHGEACPQAWIDQLSLTGIFTNIADDQRECPNIVFGGGFSGIGGPVNAYTASNQPMWDISNTATWVKGSHSLTFGANYRRWWLQRDLATGFTGNFNFNVGFTGNFIADFLLGTFGSAAAFQPAAFAVPGKAGNPREMNFMYFAPYIQDDWKISRKLTLNLGLRYDYRNVPYETNNRMGWRNLAYPQGGLLVADESLAAGGIIPGNGYYQLAGRRSPENPDRYKVVAPRIGFAYRPTASGDTVIRGGYGIFYDSAEGREIDGSADIYPYVTRSNFTQSLGTTPLRTTDQVFPSFADPLPASPSANTFLAVSMSPEPRNPYVQQWTLGVERQITRTTTGEVNYVGSHGSNLLMRINIAQALPYTASNPTVAGRKPFPNFATYIDSTWSGWSDYHALNATLTHRGRALITTLAYTWSKSTDSKSGAATVGATETAGFQGFLNNHDVARDHGLSSFDVEHRMVASFVWNLPFGKGERFAGGASGLKQAVLGGWQVNGVYLWQGGFPITITARDIGGVLDSFGTNRADIVGDIHSGGGSITEWFNRAAFAQPALGAFGNSGRSILRGPSNSNVDLSLFKNFSLPRNSTLQLRLEAFNALNHPNFLGVSQNISAPNFGVITSARDGRNVQLGVKLIW